MLFLPKDSVTFDVRNQNSNIINGLILYSDSVTDSFRVEYDVTSTVEITNLVVKYGNYSLIFEIVKEGYSCPKLFDDFTLEKDGKVKLEYTRTKDN